MTDKKLTDKEIVNALEESISFDEPYESDFTLIRIEYIKNALDLINRLQAENERLQRKIEDLESVQEISPEAKYFVDTKADKVISLLNEVAKSQEQIKAEAYKEFAERLKTKASNFEFGKAVWVVYIDNLLKEKVGGDK